MANSGVNLEFGGLQRQEGRRQVIAHYLRRRDPARHGGRLRPTTSPRIWQFTGAHRCCLGDLPQPSHQPALRPRGQLAQGHRADEYRDPVEGDSTTCANPGVVLTQAGKSTLILDCGLPGPARHTVFGFCNFRGWGTLSSYGASGAGGLARAVTQNEDGYRGWSAARPGKADYLPAPRAVLRLDGAGVRLRAAKHAAHRDSSPIPPFWWSRERRQCLNRAGRSEQGKANRQALCNLEGVAANVLKMAMNNVEVPKGECRYYGYAHETKAAR